MMFLLGFIVCLSAAGSQTSMHMGEAVVMLQHHAQRAQPNLHFNNSFAQTFLEVEQQGALDQEAFKAIKEQAMTLEIALTKDRKRHLLECKKELEVAHNSSRAVKLVNMALEAELGEVNQYNMQMGEKAMKLKQENLKLAAQVRKLRNDLSVIVERESAALESAEKSLHEQAAELHDLLNADASHRQEIALISFGIAQLQAPNKPMALMRSLKKLLTLTVRLDDKSNTELEAAFMREMKATEAERSGFLKTQMELNHTLARAKMTSAKLAEAVRRFEETKQSLMSLRSFLQQRLPERMPTSVVKVNDSFDDKSHSETYWADQAYQLNSNQGEYDLVMSVPQEGRKEMYTRIQAGPCLPPQNKTNITYEKDWISEEIFAERYARYGMDRVRALVGRGVIEKRYNPDCPRRNQYFVPEEKDVFAALPCQPTPNTTSVHFEKTWMSEANFRKKYERYGTDHVQKLLERGTIESRRNPDCPRRKQYFVENEEAVLAAFPCLPPQNTSKLYKKEHCHATCYNDDHKDVPWNGRKCLWENCHGCDECANVWMSEETFRQKYGIGHVDVLLARGIVEQRQNPDCPRRIQYLAKDEREVLAYVPKTHWIGEKILHETYSDDVIAKKIQEGSMQTRKNPDIPNRTQYKEAKYGQSTQVLATSMPVESDTASALKASAGMQTEWRKQLAHSDVADRKASNLDREAELATLPKDLEASKLAKVSGENNQFLEAPLSLNKNEEAKHKKLTNTEAADNQTAASKPLSNKAACSSPSPQCEAAVKYAMAQVEAKPTWYPGLTAKSDFEDFQAHFAREKSAGCECSHKKISMFVHDRNQVMNRNTISQLQDTITDEKDEMMITHPEVEAISETDAKTAAAWPQRSVTTEEQHIVTIGDGGEIPKPVKKSWFSWLMR